MVSSATLGPSYWAICGFLMTVLGCLLLDLTYVGPILDQCCNTLLLFDCLLLGGLASSYLITEVKKYWAWVTTCMGDHLNSGLIWADA